MKTSVCMAIYNGEKYIEKQLKSILEQTVSVDEVILCDDCSTDNTVAVLEKFIKQNHLEKSWKIFRNEENKGYPGNFYYSMSLCTGDIVFLADQDDLWEENKVEEMTEILQENDHMNLLSSKWGMVDSRDKVINKKGSNNYGSKDCNKINLEQVLYYFDWPGMTMCFRNIWYKEKAKKVEKTEIPHDMALAVMAAEEGSFYCVDYLYQYHRRHDENVALEEHRIRKLLNRERKILEVELYLKKMIQILDSQCLTEPTNIQKVQKKHDLMQERLTNLQIGSRKNIWRQYKNNRESVRLATALCDLLICKQK